MTQGFESVKHELEQKRLQLEQDLAAIRGRAAVIEADLERVHEALGALTGQKGGQKKKARRSTRGKKSATTVQDLQRYITRVREEKPFAYAAELEKGVRALVQESGSSLSRFKALFAEALLTSPGSQGSIAQVEHPSPFEPSDDPQPAPGQEDQY